MFGHSPPVGSSEKCHKRKSLPNLMAKCSERDAQSARETFHGRSSVSIADLPVKKLPDGNAWPIARKRSTLRDARSKCDVDLEPTHSQNSSRYCCYGRGKIFVRETGVDTIRLEPNFNTLHRLIRREARNQTWHREERLWVAT